MQQSQNPSHPILTEIPKDWTVAEDELYINLQFDADTLLSSMGEDPAYQRLVANAAHFEKWAWP